MWIIIMVLTFGSVAVLSRYLVSPTLTKVLEAEGFNCGFNFGPVAGAGVTDHLHLHVVPRWRGDHNFMPVLAETRSMPEHLSLTYDKLIKHYQNLSL